MPRVFDFLVEKILIRRDSREGLLRSIISHSTAPLAIRHRTVDLHKRSNEDKITTWKVSSAFDRPRCPWISSVKVEGHKPDEYLITEHRGSSPNQSSFKSGKKLNFFAAKLFLHHQSLPFYNYTNIYYFCVKSILCIRMIIFCWGYLFI